MKIYFMSDYGKQTSIDVESNTESEIYRAIAKELVTFEPTCSVRVSNEEIGSAAYQVATRSGTILVSETRNNFWFSGTATYPHVYLTCVEYGLNDYTGRDKNHYKFYELEQKGDEVIATYGRIGSKAGERFGVRSCKYPLSMFWIKYEEKIAKGYKDKSDIYLSDEKKEKVPTIDDLRPVKRKTVAVKLFEQLKAFCRSYIEKTCKSSKVTTGMIDESKRLLSELYKTTSVDEFNKILIELLAISPRRVAQVYELLAQDPDEFAEIISREEDLVNAMEGLKEDPTDVQPFTDVKVKKTSEEDKAIIDNMLAPELKGRVTGTWKISSEKFEHRYNRYCKDNKITKTKLLWHGSRNENWLSIINNGLLLNPNAIITGKMFGNGIYFAPSCMKSWGYTSHIGARWTGGDSNISFMGIYETAYGDPLVVSSAHHFTQAELERYGKNCVHAERGSQLRADEIVYYSESAMVLRYLVRFTS